MDSDENLDKVWSQIPTDTDILLTHGPPYGIMDLCKSGESAGSATLLKQVLTRIKPIYHIFGHIHETYGEYQHPDIRTKFINASTCTYHYKPKNMPVVFELPIKK